MRLALGTVQFGLAYGISNSAGEVADDELDTILALAHQLGVDTLDTAQAYGNAEARLGSRHTADFQLVNKLAPGIQATEVATSVTSSLQRLGRVSVYAPEELALWLEQGHPLELVQLPANLLDQRFLRSGWLDRLQDLGCEIHVRSLFLQGLLLMQPDLRPDHFHPFSEQLARLDGWQPHSSPLHKALSLIPALPQVSRFVVGVCHAHELAAIASAYAHQHPCHDNELAALACDEPALINPALWRTS
jgi:aryl-alcohol dehydrogenase-like predicted oxidoreductase